ncbi:hypothetical protein EW145_g101 [Phellinidium pouzarii]|uniref:N-acetyltransferase domain-containing protein n=1 Tax=Phellinidium pouzarii TaxID=167371 RepID=A0A4S4LLD4_9AGAM|nr:hypothetical protein EW145_g101 [Phellinidium pouzarii]
MSHSTYGSMMQQQLNLLGAGIDEKQLLQYLSFEAASTMDCLLAEKVKVKRMRTMDAKQASRTLYEASEHDPVFIYARDTPDARDSPFTRRIERLQFAIAAQQWARRKIGLTVNHGRAVVCASVASASPPAPEAEKRGPIDKQVDNIYRLIGRLLNLVGKSKEQRKRFDEVQMKLGKYAEEMLGEDMKKMRSVNALATAPAFQRRGYGGALVDAITELADAEGRSTYLFSSNPINTEFYNSHGFFTLAVVSVGDDNPTWKRPPVLIPLMVRIYGDK